MVCSHRTGLAEPVDSAIRFRHMRVAGPDPEWGTTGEGAT